MKKNTRRQFIEQGIRIGLLSPLLSSGMVGCRNESDSAAVADEPTQKSLNILILGGTSFLGPHQVAYAVSRGHKVSTFTRGKTKPTIHTELFEQVEALIGDREDNLTVLENRSWDVVIDNSGRKVEWTKKTAELLKDNVGLYLYTSSTGVYYPYLGDNIHEDTPLVLEMPDDVASQEFKYEYDYGIMKANSEMETIKAFGVDRSIIVRPTYMFGPADRTDRFVYWPLRLAKGGEIMIPGKTTDPVQYIDVRDVAEWMIRMAETQVTGSFNAVGPATPRTLPEFVTEAQQAFDVASTLVQIDDYEFLKQHKVEYIVPWIMPEGNQYGSARTSNSKAIAVGLSFRYLADSIKDTYDWWHSAAVTEERRMKYAQNEQSIMNREGGILARWKALQEA